VELLKQSEMGDSQRKLAAKFGISKTQVLNILRDKDNIFRRYNEYMISNRAPNY
jgi:transcriptional regulator with XRE-family HTH domain